MTTPNSPLPDAAVAAFARGDVLAAIQAIRRAGPIDLASAKRAIEAHAKELGGQRSQLPKPAGSARATSQESDARQASRAHAPESMLGQRTPTVVAGDAPGSMRWLLAVLILLAAAAVLGLL